MKELCVNDTRSAAKLPDPLYCWSRGVLPALGSALLCAHRAQDIPIPQLCHKTFKQGMVMVGFPLHLWILVFLWLGSCDVLLLDMFTSMGCFTVHHVYWHGMFYCSTCLLICDVLLFTMFPGMGCSAVKPRLLGSMVLPSVISWIQPSCCADLRRSFSEFHCRTNYHPDPLALVMVAVWIFDPVSVIFACSSVVLPLCHAALAGRCWELPQCQSQPAQGSLVAADKLLTKSMLLFLSLECWLCTADGEQAQLALEICETSCCQNWPGRESSGFKQPLRLVEICPCNALVFCMSS